MIQPPRRFPLIIQAIESTTTIRVRKTGRKNFPLNIMHILSHICKLLFYMNYIACSAISIAALVKNADT
jgi:hypothetical protein